jgi:flagellar hook-associated protein 2
MGSVTNSLSGVTAPVTSSSSSSSSSSSNPTGIFTGTSAYSTDFQNVINRAVAIANLPINLLTNQQTALTNQSNELSTIDSLFGKLQTAVQGIGDAVGGAAFTATSSNANEVTATLADGATEGVYSIQVDDIGAYATSLTGAWNQPALSSGQTATYDLVVGNQLYSFQTSDNSANGVAQAINAKYGNLVHAVPVQVDSGGMRISLQSNTLVPMTLDITQPPGAGTSLQQLPPTGEAISQTAQTWNSSSSAYTLVVNGTSYDVTPGNADYSASSVASSINSVAASQGLSVQATAVNLGTTNSPDWRIQLQGTAPGAMTLDIQNGTGASLQTPISQTPATWNSTADVAGTRSVYTLALGSNTYSFTTTDNSASTVASTINGQFGNLVQATVVDLGTNGSHDYRIALQSKTGGVVPDLLKATTTSYETSSTAGKLATYELYGQAQQTSTTRAIEVSTGVTLNLLGTTGGAPVSVTVSRSTSALSTALSSFADAYNAVVDEVAKQRGQSAGPLQGQSILNTLSQTLSQISTYNSGNGAVNGLPSLGLTFDSNNNGHLDFNSLNLDATDFSNSSGVTAFLGSAASGGFLKTATDALNNLEDSTTGQIKTAESDLKTQISNIGNQITTKQNQVYQLQTTLTRQMAAADALIASMEQQYSYLNSMFSAQQTAAQSYK